MDYLILFGPSLVISLQHNLQGFIIHLGTISDKLNHIRYMHNSCSYQNYFVFITLLYIFWVICMIGFLKMLLYG